MVGEKEVRFFKLKIGRIIEALGLFLFLFSADIVYLKTDDHIGHGAHLAGALFGIITVFILEPELRKKITFKKNPSH